MRDSGVAPTAAQSHLPPTARAPEPTQPACKKSRLRMDKWTSGLNNLVMVNVYRPFGDSFTTSYYLGVAAFRASRERLRSDNSRAGDGNQIAMSSGRAQRPVK